MKRNLLCLATICVVLIGTLAAQAQVITTVAGNGTPGHSGDGTSAIGAQIDLPMDLAIVYDGADVKLDASGNLIFSDQQNHVIRKVNFSTGNIDAIVGIYTGSGMGFGNYGGDLGPATAAELNFPAGIAIDASGNLYFCDYGNNLIRRVDHSTNIITTVAGTLLNNANTGDGLAAVAASIGQPICITFDAAGNYYFSDIYNNVVRKVNITSGIISTVAGGGSGTDGGPATSAFVGSSVWNLVLMPLVIYIFLRQVRVQIR